MKQYHIIQKHTATEDNLLTEVKSYKRGEGFVSIQLLKPLEVKKGDIVCLIIEIDTNKVYAKLEKDLTQYERELKNGIDFTSDRIRSLRRLLK